MTDKRLDSEFNAAFKSEVLGQGTSKDRVASVRPSTAHQLTPGELTAMYRDNWLARRIINLPADDCTRKGWTVKLADIDDTDDDDSDPYAPYLMRLKARQSLNLADRWARLKGGGAIIVVLADGLTLADPVAVDGEGRPTGIDSVLNLIVSHRYELIPATVVPPGQEGDAPWDWDILSPGFGLPLWYEWTPTKSTKGKVNRQFVHRDRVIRFEGAAVDPDEASTYNWWGASELQAMYETLRNYGVAENAIANTVAAFHYPVVKIKGLADLLTAGLGGDDALGKAAVKSRLDTLSESQSILNMYVCDADGESIERLGSPVAGLSDLVRLLMLDVSGGAQMSTTKLWGQSPPGLSTDDAAGSRNWNEYIAGRQTNRYEQPIARLVEFVMASKAGPSKGQFVEFSVIFNPLDEPTESESAGVYKTYSEADDKYYGMDAITAKEARSRLEGAQVNRFLTLDPVEEEDDEALALGTAQDVQKTAMNGAQITALQGMLESVAAGQLPADAVVAAMMVGFQLSEAEAKSLLAPMKGFTIPAEGE